MVYILLADGFEEMEAFSPYDILKRASVNVKLVSSTDEWEVKGAHEISVNAEMKFCDISADEIDMLVLPGGMPGCRNLDNLSYIDDLLKKVYNDGGYIAAICAAPSILGKRGYLKGRNAVSFPSFQKYLEGANIIKNERVVVDGKIITAVGAGAAVEFGLKLVELLTDKKTSDEIRASMY